MDGNSYYTLIGKTFVCPIWNVKVMIQGKYRIIEDMGSGQLISVSCPIIENSKLPIHKQCPEYKLMRCNHSGACKHLNELPKCVDADTGQPV